jgi:hypothetical protein
LHGYRLITDVVDGMPPGSVVEDDVVAGTAALEVLRGVARSVPQAPPDGRLLAMLSDGDRETYYSFARDDSRMIMRFHGAVDFEGDPELTWARGHVAPGADPGLLGVLLQGTVMAARLILDGRLVLHASAVATPAGAVAFVGEPGTGKSTLAALGLAAGLGLVTDDVLRVDLDGPGVQVWPGAVEARLRDSARSLTELVPGGARDTADGRCAVGGATVDPMHPLPLAAVVAPNPDRGCVAPQARRLDPFEALRVVMAAPRIVGWCDPVTLGQQFQLVADLCERVPVFAVDVPWGPPFAADTMPRLLDVLDLG